MDVLLLRALAPAGVCLPSCCLAMDLYVTIRNNESEIMLKEAVVTKFMVSLRYASMPSGGEEIHAKDQNVSVS
jgi:hypothetical protein